MLIGSVKEVDTPQAREDFEKDQYERDSAYVRCSEWLTYCRNNYRYE